MARAFFYAFIALLYASVFAAPTTSDTSDASIEGFSIGDIINALGIGFVTHIHVVISLESLTTNLVSIDFDGLSSVQTPRP